MKKTALIMAGGRGERFWPKSRQKLPKQFLSLTGNGKTMIQLTVERILPLVSMEDIFIVTNQDYKNLVVEQLPLLPVENIICEPVGRNTAPCIGLGAIYITQKYKDAIMFVLPSDHLIKYNSIFQRTLSDAALIAADGQHLVTIGITPDYPETGYGYIKFSPEKMINTAYAVEHFAEKPDHNTAVQYINSEQYLWNSGMFIWKASSILSNIAKFMPETYHSLRHIQDSIDTDNHLDILRQEFLSIKSESVDYGILEHANDIFVIAGSFGWDDVGSWLAVERIQPVDEFGNVISGMTVSINTKNTIIQGNEKLITTVGIEDLIIVDSDNALLICAKNSAGDIKKVLENLRICNRTEYL